MLLSGQPVAPNGTFTQADVNNGLVSYQQTDLTKASDSLTVTATDSFPAPGHTTPPRTLTVVVGNGINSPTITQFDTATSPPTTAKPLLSGNNTPTLKGVGAPGGSNIDVYANGNLATPVASGTADAQGTGRRPCRPRSPTAPTPSLQQRLLVVSKVSLARPTAR